jgi:hypothetical protein
MSEEGAGMKLSVKRDKEELGKRYKEPGVLRREMAALHEQIKVAEDSATIIGLQQRMNALYQEQKGVYPMLGKKFNPNAEREYAGYRLNIAGRLDSGASESKAGDSEELGAGEEANEGHSASEEPWTATQGAGEEAIEGENAVAAVRNFMAATEGQGAGEKAYMASQGAGEKAYMASQGAGEEAAVAVLQEQLATATKSPCPQLYDPCTQAPLASFQELERRVKELRKLSDTTPVSLFGLNATSTMYDFLTTVFINPAISLDDMVTFKLAPGRPAGADMYEVLSRLFLFFGGIENVNPKAGGNYRFMQRIEGGGKVYADPLEAFREMKCLASSVSGVSDVTLINVRNDGRVIRPDDPYCEVSCDSTDSVNVKTYLVSVKWYKTEKNAEYYDLEKLFVAGNKLATAEQKPLDIIVFLKSKRDFEIAHNRAFRQYTRELAKTFFGYNEDVKPFLQEVRRSILESAAQSGSSPLDTLRAQYLVAGSKPVLSLQLHQDIIVDKVCDALNNENEKLYLVGVLPRGGKTFIAGGIMREYLRRTKVPSMNIFWLTAAPNETMTQVRDELLNRFQDFADFEFIHVRDVGDLKKQKHHSVFFCSSQLLVMLQKAAKPRQGLIDLLTGKDRLGLIFFDEAHKTGAGSQTKEEVNKIINTYKQYELPFIFLTATYYNILFEYNVHKDNTFIWDYTDVLSARALATDSEQENALVKLYGRFGEETVRRVIDRRTTNGDSLASMARAYVGFPDLYFISANFQAEALARFEAQGTYRPDDGFSLDAIFALRPGTSIANIKTADNKIRRDAFLIFNDLVGPKNMISLITPKETFDVPEVGEEGGIPLVKPAGSPLEVTLLGRINHISSEAKSRFRLDERPSMLMFMPTGGQGTNIFYLLCAWGSLLLAHKWWRDNYEVVCVVSDEALTEEAVASEHSEGLHVISRGDVKSSILSLERRLHCQPNPKGLVILAGEKLSMGISLPCTDVVFLLNQKKSPDDIIQKMYRALTPSVDKKAAFIVDLNPVRSLAALYGYTKASQQDAPSASSILNILYNTYSWDADVFEYDIKRGADARPLSFQSYLGELFKSAESDKSNEYRIHEDLGGLEKRLAQNIRRVLDPALLGKLTNALSAKKLEKAAIAKFGLSENSKVVLHKGKLLIKKERPANEGAAAPAEEADNIELFIDNFVEVIVDFIKYLAITSGESSLESAISEYEANVVNQNTTSLQQNVMRLIRARSVIHEKGDKTLLPQLLLAAVKEFAPNTSSRIFSEMKGKVADNTTKKDKILELIHRRLTPRKKQKEESGEVFTPMELVEEMLAKLPNSVWSNPDLKWLDPANGIGNFPVMAFYKLNEGLRSWEPDDVKRKKHIVQNMLFMLELQSNNNRIARNIFKSLCNCDPNILTINTLTVTPQVLSARGFPVKYDIIMGNPPFNAGGLLKGGGTLWPKFVGKAFELINENGYICFIHPPGWRKFYDPEDRDNQGKIWYTIREREWNLDYINISDKPPKHFPVVDYYVIHAKKSEKPTKYNSTFMGHIDHGESAIEFPFIPNMLNSDTLSILRKLFAADGEEINIVYNQTFKPTEKDKGANGVVHYHFTKKTGEKVVYKRQYPAQPEYIGKDKVIMTHKGGYEKGRLFAFYSEGTMGTTNNSMYMLTESKAQGERLVSFLNSNIVTFLMKITQYSASPNHINEFKILNRLKMPASLESYHLTKSEKELIASIVGAPAEAEEVHVEGGRRRKPRSKHTRKRRNN